MMPSVWTQCLFLASIAVLLVSTEAVQVSQACYGSDVTLDCLQHNLWCQHGSIFITQALRGFKPVSHWCDVQRPECWDIYTCCQYFYGDCLDYYTQEVFSYLSEKCWNKQSCRYMVPNANRITCKSNYKNGSGYSRIEYLCLPDSAMGNFSDSGLRTNGSLVLRYTSSSGTGSHVCLVETEDCSNCIVNVLLYRTSTVSNLGNCTSVAVSGGYWLPCKASLAQYGIYLRQTPFSVWLAVNKNNDANETWAFIYGNTAIDLRVTCELWNDGGSLPQSSSATSPTTTTETTTTTTTLPTEGQTTGSSATPGTTSAAGVQSSSSTSTSSPANVSSPDVSGDTMPQSSGNSSNTAGIVGGVVGALLLLAVVVAVVVFFLKRRNPTTNSFAKVVAWFKGGNSSRSHGNSGRAEQHVMYAQPTSLPVYDNSAAAITDEAEVHVDPDSDYNHLGQKPTSSASRDVTYGHLAVGSAVADYGYDHVAKGKPAVRSGDVINNIYNTAGPPTAGSCDEDAYNVTGAAKNRAEVINNVYNTAGPATGGSCDEDFYNTTVRANNRPDVINNVYNTPSPATEASPDVDYYNTAGVPQTGPDVINNDYDIPKSARTPGPGETEAHDVTGDDAGSPYELARNVK